jgi:hypothetical protein
MSSAASRLRGPAAVCLAVALASGLAGCRPRMAAGHQVPAIPPATSVGPVGGTAGAGGTVTTAPAPAVGRQDVDNLNGILASVGGAVTSVRSAIAGDSSAPKG